MIGGCIDDKFAYASNLLFREIKLGIKQAVISEIIIRELEEAPLKVKEIFNEHFELFEILSLNDEVSNLAKNYLEEKVVTQKSFNDAAHIAFATVYQIDLLVSWNFKHIVNHKKIIQFNAINLKNGYKTIQIYSPQEVLEIE